MVLEEQRIMKPELKAAVYRCVALVCVAVLAPGDIPAFTPQQTAPAKSSTAQAAKIPPDQLDSLVAPIALYPDPLLAQVLAASTYPLEIILFSWAFWRMR